MKFKFFVVLSVLFITIACNRQAKQTEKDMTQLSFNPEQAAYMTAIACNEAKGDIPALELVINGGLDEGLTVSQIKEALSQLYAYTGFPRSLNALSALQKVLEQRKREGKQIIEGQEASPLPKDYDAWERGGKVQTQLSGGKFNYDFSPATDYYLKAHLFGDIFVRDNLTYADRELVTVSALCGLEGVEMQLKAHINGARNMGVTEEQLQTIVVALATKVGANEAGRMAGLMQTKWPKGQPNTAYSQYFVGNSFLYPYFDGVANVTFEPVCRNNWHIHHGTRQML
ncbi:MAG: carboxymuconolactone decarboxylase family protein, partial [Bacteroidales bacterium]|nr:carboxymuconolactone decarboxylase family protein [Bacteroidales bacterium]